MAAKIIGIVLRQRALPATFDELHEAYQCGWRQPEGTIRVKTLSFIMATRNAERFLPEALASMAFSLGSNAIEMEIIVADGGSNDATLQIASTHPKARIVSRADTGIYDGMNRAIAAASGEYCLILNSDDVLTQAGLGKAVALLAANPGASFASGPALFGVGLGEATARVHPGPLTQEGAMFGIPAINARLFCREFLQGAGPIRTDIGLAADREFLARLARSSGHGIGVNDPFYFYRIHTDSKTISGDAAGRSRVFDAEIQLAEALAQHEDEELRRLARAAGAVAKLKRMILRQQRPSRSNKQCSSLFDLANGIMLARKWRGHLSGY